MPHATDSMHLENNIFESTIGLLLVIKGKKKDGLKSWTNLVDQGIILELHLGPLQNGKVNLCGASYNLTTYEKRATVGIS